MGHEGHRSFGLPEHLGKISAAKFKESWTVWPEGVGVLAAGVAAGAVEAALRGLGTTTLGMFRGVGAAFNGALRG